MKTLQARGLKPTLRLLYQEHQVKLQFEKYLLIAHLVVIKTDS